jgi:hypothetical protein
MLDSEGHALCVLHLSYDSLQKLAATHAYPFSLLDPCLMYMV